MDIHERIEEFRAARFKDLAIPLDIAVSMALYEMLKRAREMPPETKEDMVTATAYTKAIMDLMSAKYLIDAMQQHGRPRELIFIDQEGNSHDLLKHKELNYEEGVNLFLDYWEKRG